MSGFPFLPIFSLWAPRRIFHISTCICLARAVAFDRPDAFIGCCFLFCGYSSNIMQKKSPFRLFWTGNFQVCLSCPLTRSSCFIFLLLLFLLTGWFQICVLFQWLLLSDGHFVCLVWSCKSWHWFWCDDCDCDDCLWKQKVYEALVHMPYISVHALLTVPV